MKEIFLLVLCCTAITAVPCCNNSQHVREGGYCDDGRSSRINIACPNGYLPLKDVTLKEDKVYTKDAPNFVFASDPNEYCVGEMLVNKSKPELGRIPIAIVCFQQEFTDNNYEITGVLTLISVVFLVLTFGVYMFLPQLRDLHSLCCMCLCISMAIGFLSLGIIQLNPGFEQEMCTVAGFLVYFWMMATFFWMNVICINVYRTVLDSGYLKRTERKQFFIYSCYAWGCTMAWFIVALITNFVKGDHLKPGIGSNTCWFEERKSTWVFFYGPIAILITVNVALFVLSSLNLWKHTRKYEMSKLNNLKYKFLLSLKLLLVMGISWIFEIVSFAHGGYHIIWKIMDVFNCLQGVIIFLILVVLRKRAVQGLVEANCCVFITRGLADKLSPHDDSDDQQILGDEHTEVRLH